MRPTCMGQGRNLCGMPVCPRPCGRWNTWGTTGRREERGAGCAACIPKVNNLVPTRYATSPDRTQIGVRQSRDVTHGSESRVTSQTLDSSRGDSGWRRSGGVTATNGPLRDKTRADGPCRDHERPGARLFTEFKQGKAYVESARPPRDTSLRCCDVPR